MTETGSWPPAQAVVRDATVTDVKDTQEGTLIMEETNRVARPATAPGRPAAAPGRPNTGGRRPGLNKVAIGRIKLAAIALSVVAFLASLAGVVQASPAAIARTNAAAQASALTQVAPVLPPARLGTGSSNGDVAPLVLPQRPQMPTIRPMIRSRGS
jgi:hypothetical protein